MRLPLAVGRAIVSLLCLSAATVASAGAGTLQAKLRNEVVELGPWQGEDGLTALTALAARSASLGEDPYRNTEAWGDLPSLRLYLVGHDPARPEALRQELASRGCSVLSYVPDDTWLVAGTPQAVREAVTETGAPVANYEAAYKIAPEWGPIRASFMSKGTRRHLDESNATAKPASMALEQLLSAVRTLEPGLLPLPVASRLSARRRLAALGPGSAPPQYAVSVQLMALVPGAALEAAEEDWAAALWQHLGATGPEGCRPVVAAPRHHATGRVLDVEGGAYAATLEVYLCRQDLLEGLSWLADLSVVTWVAPTFEVQDMDAYSNIVIQTGGMTTEQARNPLAESSRPYHAAGLTGTGEIVGMADTGIDLDNCLFHDTRFTNYRTMLRTLADGSQRLEMPDHRKVVQYHIPRGANFADEGGHGSHVAGTIAGSRQSGVYDTATGAGLATRLSLFDTGPLDPEGRRVIPSGVEVNLLPIHRDVGAAITTDSWAGARPTYDRDAGGFDTFLWRNPMMCSFVVAGNSGTNGMADGGTVGSPGVSKNPVTIGGSDRMNSATEGWQLFVVRGFTASGAQTFYLHMWPYQDPGQPNITTVLDVGQTVPLIIGDACGEGSATARGAFVLVPAGCDDTTAARNILNRGGLAMLVGENDNTRGLPAPTVRLASALVVEGIANWIFGNASRSSRITITRALIPYNVDNLSPFSSFGPLRDGRIKPDIIAPGGNIESAKSDGKITGGSCSSATTFMSGTSQATPTAAGHAALMRQYFRDGFYPDGDAEGPNSTPFTPSGMLIKAVAIAGAEDMQGGIHVGLGLRIGPAPNGFQGFGRMSLAGSLPLKGYSDADFSLQVADMAQFTATGQSLTLNGLTATGTGPVSVALVWYDYPGETWTYDVLVNDLDLAVDIGGRTLRGNNQEDDDTQAPDRVNTVERVRVLQPPAGARISISVRANQIRHRTVGGPDSDLPQRFAVAVVGYYTGNIQSDLNPARNADRGSSSASPPPTRASPRPPSPSFSPPPSPRLSPTPPPSKVSSPPPPKVRARPPPHPPRPPRPPRPSRPPRPPPRPRPPRPPPRPRPPPKGTTTQRSERRAARLARREDSGNPKLVIRNG